MCFSALAVLRNVLNATELEFLNATRNAESHADRPCRPDRLFEEVAGRGPQVRRGIEYLESETYAKASYYEKCLGTSLWKKPWRSAFRECREVAESADYSDEFEKMGKPQWARTEVGILNLQCFAGAPAAEQRRAWC